MTETKNTGLGRAMKTLRTTARLTIRQAAEVACVSPSYWTNAENGKVTPKPLWVANVIEAIGSHIEDAA